MRAFGAELIIVPSQGGRITPDLTPRMIERARDGGRQVGLVTSKNRREIDGTLELLGFGSLLDFVICSEDAPRPKPAPDPVFEALKRAGAAAHETLFIGDSIYDMRAGADAGVNTGAALWGPFSRTVLERERPTFYFESPAAVIAALELDLHDTATPRLVRNVVGAGLKPAPTRPEAQPESGVPPRPDLHDLAAPRSERNVVGAGFKPAPARPEAAGGTAGDASSTEEPR